MSMKSIMSTATKIKLSAFVVAALAIMTAIWHFAWLGYCDGSRFCLFLAITTIAIGFDIVKYFEEYFTATPNRPRNWTRTIVNTITKVFTLFVMLEISANFSAKDVIIKHPNTYLMELSTIIAWYITYSWSQVSMDRYFAKKAASATTK